MYATLYANLPWMWGESGKGQEMFALINPNVKLPSRKSISGKVLKDEDERYFNSKIAELKNCYSVGLVLDSWKSIRRHSLLGFLITSNYSNNDVQLLYDLEDITSYQKTGEFIEERIQSLTAEIYSKHNVLINFIITDGGGEMKKACRLIKQSLPNKITIWCNSHLLNLLYGDLVKNIGRSLISDMVDIVNWI